MRRGVSWCFLSEKIHHGFIKHSFWDVGYRLCFCLVDRFFFMNTLVWNIRSYLNYMVVSWVKTTKNHGSWFFCSSLVTQLINWLLLECPWYLVNGF